MKVNIKKIYTALLLIMPIINSYNFFALQNFYIFTLIGILFSIIYLRDEKNIQISLALLTYFFYVVFSCVNPVIFLGLGVSSILTRLIRFLSYFLIFFIMGYRLVDQKYLYNIYKGFCVAFSVVIIIQYIFSLLGHPFTLIIPNTMINGEINSNEYIANQINGGRFSTFFLEPAHQAQYMLPCLCLSLFMEDENGKADLKNGILITIGLVATTSMQGILGAAIIWIMYYGDILRSKNPKKLLQLVVLVAIAIPLIMLISKQPIIQEQFRKKASSFNGIRIVRGTSAYARLLVGWEAFGKLDIIHKLFGTGFRYIEAYLEESGIGRIAYAGTLVGEGYMNGMSKMLFSIGIVGTILFYAVMISFIYKKTDKTIVSLFVCFFIIMLTSDCYEQFSMYLPVLLIINRAYLNGHPIESQENMKRIGIYQYGNKEC